MMQRTQRTAMNELCNAYSASRGDLHGYFAEADKLSKWCTPCFPEPNYEVAGDAQNSYCGGRASRLLTPCALRGPVRIHIVSLFNGREMRWDESICGCRASKGMFALRVVILCRAQKPSSVTGLEEFCGEEPTSFLEQHRFRRPDLAFSICFGLGSPLVI